jgi:hypothetical protein
LLYLLAFATIFGSVAKTHAKFIPCKLSLRRALGKAVGVESRKTGQRISCLSFWICQRAEHSCWLQYLSVDYGVAAKAKLLVIERSKTEKPRSSFA